MDAAAIRQAESAVRCGRESGEDFRRSRESAGQAGFADRARSVPDRNGPAGRCRLARRQFATKKTAPLTNTAGEVQRTLSQHRSAGPAQRLRSSADSVAPALPSGLGHQPSLRTPDAAFEEIRQNVPGLQSSRSPGCFPAPRSWPPPAARPLTGHTACRRARCFHPTTLFLPAARSGVTVPSSNLALRRKRNRGLHRPAPNPGGIASQGCRLAVCGADGDLPT